MTCGKIKIFEINIPRKKMIAMRLRIKLLLTLVVLAFVAFMIIVVAINVFVLPAFERAESEEVGEGLTRALNVINISISQLESSAKDWAYWDDTYQFLQGNHAGYVQSNIVPGTFESLKLNVMAFIDPDGALVLGKAYDYENGEEIPLPEGLDEKLGALASLAMEGGRSGVLALPGGTMIFSVQPVLKSSMEGPPAGALFMGRFLDQSAVDSISQTILLPVSLQPYDLLALPEGFASAKAALASGGTAVIPINSSTVLGYAVINDVFGKPSLAVGVSLERHFYRTSLAALTHSVTSAFLALSLSFVALYASIEVGSMRKISRLRKEMMKIGERRDFSKRVREEGDDEISDLAKSANWMLSALESSSEELKRYAARLEELVEEQTAKLREKERLAAIGETATMVGHDLRNPLQSLMNIVYLMEEDGASLPPEKREMFSKWLGKLKDNVAYMDKIVSDLQDMTRPLKVDFTEVQLDRLLMDVLDDLKVPEGVHVSLEIEPGAEKVVTDPLILKRILHNLVINAFQAMPGGGRLTIAASLSGGEILIRVTDTGVGMDEETLKKIFTPLFTTKAKGTGLGLAVCKRLVEALGGSISVKSSKGVGTTFTLRLPINKGSGANPTSTMKPS